MNLNPEDFKIVICDDAVTNVMILEKLCQSVGFKHIEKITDPRKVMPTLEASTCDLLLLDIEMPHLNGFQVMEQVRAKFSEDVLPILILTGLQDKEIRTRALSQGASDFINKPFDQTEVILRVKNLIKFRGTLRSLQTMNEELEYRVIARTNELNYATELLISRLAQAGEIRDSDTGNHTARVGHYAKLLAEKVGLPVDICDMMAKAAPMHDIGKIGIADNILLKPGKLTQEERDEMCEHTRIGEKLLAGHDSILIQLAASIAKSHHERWDGKGYPDQLAGEAIPIEGRITAIADVFDALTTERPYKNAWSVEEALKLLQEESGKSFDPALVDIFVENIDEFVEIKTSLSD